MKAIIIRIIAVGIAIALFFTPFWQWSFPIIFLVAVSRKQPRDSIMGTVDQYI